MILNKVVDVIEVTKRRDSPRIKFVAIEMRSGTDLIQERWLFDVISKL